MTVRENTEKGGFYKAGNGESYYKSEKKCL